MLCTPLLTVLRIATGRSHFDEELNGIVTHDDSASYFALEGVCHGACNAHHLLELQALIEIEKEDWSTSTHRLLTGAHRAVRFTRESDRDVPASLVARISQVWYRILERTIVSQEEMRGCESRPRAARRTVPRP